MTAKVEQFEYTFNDIVVMGRRPTNRQHTTWYIECSECGGHHQFRKLGQKVWIAHCVIFDVEWTITPAEYYKKIPTDFSKILGYE